TLLERDVKGLYRKALAGKLPNFTGVSDSYEPPEQPDLLLETDREPGEACAARVIGLLAARGYLPPSGKGSVIAGAGPAPSDAGQGPVTPHGGQLVRRVLEGEAQEEALGRARELPVVVLDERELADVEMIGCGALSPLVG